MPSVESRLRARLKGYADVAELVGKQVYGGYAPQATQPPYIVLTRISGQPVNTLSGTNALADFECRIQVDCIAAKYDAVKQIADAVRAALSGWSDAGAKITSCHLDNEIDDTEPPEDGSNVAWQRVILDFIVWYQ